MTSRKVRFFFRSGFKDFDVTGADLNEVERRAKALQKKIRAFYFKILYV